jgi:hypothetical protein
MDPPSLVPIGPAVNTVNTGATLQPERPQSSGLTAVSLLPLSPRLRSLSVGRTCAFELKPIPFFLFHIYSLSFESQQC